jgi:hypothetical protein
MSKAKPSAAMMQISHAVRFSGLGAEALGFIVAHAADKPVATQAGKRFSPAIPLRRI